MESTFEILRLLSAAAFLFYGVACLATDHMVAEFERYGLARFRVLTGCLEVAGGAGLLVGIWFPPVGVAAALGLSLLMLLGVATRVRIRDSLLMTMPAFVLFAVNLFLFTYALRSDVPT